MGFDTHPHRDMEIVTWVLQGSLVHQDSMGHSGVIYPGLAQRMSAGTGILHSEKNDSWRLGDTAGSYSGKHGDPVRFVQMWVVPDEQGITPGYEQLEIDGELLSGGLVPVASGMAHHADHAAIRIKNKYAAMHVARLQPGQPPVEAARRPVRAHFCRRGSRRCSRASVCLTRGRRADLRRRRSEAEHRHRSRSDRVGNARSHRRLVGLSMRAEGMLFVVEFVLEAAHAVVRQPAGISPAQQFLPLDVEDAATCSHRSSLLG